MRIRLRRVVIALVYAASYLAPGLHELVFQDQDEACVQCEGLLAAGPALIAACNGPAPCDNPDHHHHHGRHHHHQCPLCQHGQLAGITGANFYFTAAPETAAIAAPGSKLVSPALRFLDSRPARAPPRVS